jgi:16S rRNA (guanine966-N2)-methyltransferase
MTRIIGGLAGSLRLQTPGGATRPTSDRVREALFSSLDARNVLTGARVLDGFAGSGALGLEAASRGATQVTFVENSAAASRVIEANISALQASLSHRPELRLVRKTVEAFAKTPAGGPFELVFLDPPYELETATLEKLVAMLVPQLSAGSLVIIERSARSAPVVWPVGLLAEESKTYGDTVLYFARKS